MSSPTSTQLGAIAENLVANVLMLESSGALSPFVPQADDDGIDLLIYNKESGKALPAQVKSRTVALKKRGTEERGHVVHFEIRAATYRAERFAAAILVLTNESGYGIECAWVVPMRLLPQVARSAGKKFVIRASKSPTSKDRYTSYRCLSTSELYQKIMVQLDEAP
ncbi:MAG: hypothetical protein ACJ76Y_15695 [Thermoanaerobaculia bacterium]